MVPAYAQPMPVGHACAGCMGTVARAAAEELWFYGHDRRGGERIEAALASGGVAATIEGRYVKAPVAGEVVPLLDRVVATASAIGGTLTRGILPAGSRRS